ncbi:histidinol-phosphatase [Carboxylicivirga sp. A043]|uniref:histidinol-phosphatase n=1 Tax=Carboxylicivirga litoralis TaxID=2816963 RepID=UPI0021CAE955|nr:histidinol-phosphatase [Carboxylicivirga sp. A043]MCU4155756.1 histidinol-phosphatase [Carboxylicivirga sp. A043]
MYYFSLHTHSNFCDGKTSIEAICETAIKKGLQTLGFSSHAPVPFETKWAMHFQNLEPYVAEVKRCKEKFSEQLEIYRSLEADFIAHNRSVPFDVWRQLGQLDYIIGSVHLVSNPEKENAIWFLDGPAENYEIGLNECFDGDIRQGVRSYYRQIQEMIITQKPDMIAHIDKVVMNNKGRFFSEKDDWYQSILEQTLKVIAKAGTVIEVNTRGIYRGKYHTYFPNENIIKRCVELGIPLTVSVDAHHPGELTSEFESALKAIRQAGGKSISIFTKNGWKQKAIDAVIS